MRRARDRAATADDQYLVASNTKTFTAVMIMQARDEGRLSLDDHVGDHLPGGTPSPAHAATIRSALAHVSGMQREPHGDVWETLAFPDAERLVQEYAQAERVAAACLSGSGRPTCARLCWEWCCVSR